MFVLWSILAGCSDSAPPEETAVIPSDSDDSDTPWVDTGVFRPGGTGGVALGNDVPDHTVIIEQSGEWNLSGNPFDALVGQLRIREVVDGNEPETADTGTALDCDVTYGLQGTAYTGSNNCPGCGSIWDIQFTLSPDSVTGIDNCNDPDLPRDGDTWRMGFSGGDSTIYFNFYGTGIYVPWWGAVQIGNTVVFEWSRELAIDVPDPEDN